VGNLRRNIMRWRTRPMTAVIGAFCIILAGAGILWAGHSAWAAFENRGSPSCSWPLRIRGTATAGQAGLVGCYLRALAERDTAGLMAVADNDPAVRITQADLRYSPDARAGLATATFTPSPVDDTYVLLTITYADGASENTGILNMIAMGGPSSWRMTIGTDVNPRSGPSPSGPSPSG
jgi:hypothetical protein